MLYVSVLHNALIITFMHFRMERVRERAREGRREILQVLQSLNYTFQSQDPPQAPPPPPSPPSPLLSVAVCPSELTCTCVSCICACECASGRQRQPFEGSSLARLFGKQKCFVSGFGRGHSFQDSLSVLFLSPPPKLCKVTRSFQDPLSKRTGS